MVVAVGRWILQGNELRLCDVVMNENEWIALGENWLAKGGRTEWVWKLFVIRNGDFLGESILILKSKLEQKRAGSFDFLFREQYYCDWQRVCSDLEKNISKQMPDSASPTPMPAAHQP